MKLKFDWFLTGMAAAVALAWLFPSPGAAGGWMYPEVLTKAGVALIFFLHGVALSFAAMKAGALRWPLHLLVQSGTFLLFPLLGLGLNLILGSQVSTGMKLGIFFLCALPSTVSSSVALTAAARGNVPGAVFNATLSSLLGVFLTPFWVALVLKSTGQAQSVLPVIIDLCQWLVLPLVLGQLSRPLLGAWAARNKKYIGLVDRGTIILLVYTSFCDSFKEGVWSGHGVTTLLLVLVISVALFAVVMSVMAVCSNALGFTREDKITAMFCGSKKTLASGIPMAKLIFGAHPALGMIMLPLMIYHPLQLIICGVLAERWGKRTD